jgi:hypothetical protein
LLLSGDHLIEPEEAGEQKIVSMLVVLKCDDGVVAKRHISRDF